MKTLKNILIIVLVFTFSFSLAFYLNMDRHYCNWEDCNQQGKVMHQYSFTSDWGYEEHTDGFYVELTHFMNPEMTYEECEEYVFAGVE